MTHAVLTVHIWEGFVYIVIIGNLTIILPQCTYDQHITKVRATVPYGAKVCENL